MSDSLTGPAEPMPADPPSVAVETPAPPRFRTAYKSLAVVAAAVVASSIGYAIYLNGAFTGKLNALDIPLDKPDVYIASAKLSALPADIVQIPGLRELLTQDFVDYYEEHPDRLALAGTLKRLAFQNNFQWQDRLVARLLDAPAQVALWRDGKGRLAYAAAVLEKTASSGLMANLARVGLPDSQFSRVAELNIQGKKAPVYALKISSQSSWAVVVGEDRIAVFTHSGLLLQPSASIASKVANMAEALLGAPVADSPWHKDFGLAAASTADASRHMLAVKADFLAFGYQRFFSGLKALRFESSAQGAGWKIHAQATPQAWAQWRLATAGPQSLWRAMPRGAAFCAALPADLASLQAVAGSGLKSARWLADTQPQAALCWYGNTGLYAPLLAFQFKPSTGAKHDTELPATLAGMTATRSKDESGAPLASPEVQSQKHATLPDTLQWTRLVRNDWGYLDLPDSEGGGRGHRVALARRGDTLLASVDHRLVEQALAVAGKSAPSVDDDIKRNGAGAPLAASASMPALGALLMAEARQLAPAGQAPKFHRVTQERLRPRLLALGKYGEVGLTLPAAPLPANADPSAAVWQTLALSARTAAK
ncbi:MAG: DUF2138 family protein [Pseudomonadota bacterium]